MARLTEMYKNDVAPALMKKFEYKSVMQIPKLDKVVINIGAGDAKENTKVIDSIIADLTEISVHLDERCFHLNFSHSTFFSCCQLFSFT